MSPAASSSRAPISFERIERLDSIADREALVNLLASCVEQGASLGFMLPVDKAELRAYWAKVFAELGGAVQRCLWVARDGGGHIIGSVQLAFELRRNGRHRAEVQKLLVLPERRSGGLGTALMGELELEARSRGLTLLFLDTSEGPGGAMAFYEKLGYHYVGGIPGYALNPDGLLARNAIYFKTLKPTQAAAVAE